MAEWLRRWTWNPMGISRAGSNPAQSVRSFFSENYSEEFGNTNQNLCSQKTETGEPKILNYFSWTGHVGDSGWKRPARQSSAKNGRLAQANKMSEDGIRFHQKKIKIKRAMIAQWLRRWTWNPMLTFRARSSPARSLRSHFQKKIQKKLGTRTNTFVRKQLRLTNQRLPFTFPGKELYTAAFGDDQHDNPQQKSEH